MADSVDKDVPPSRSRHLVAPELVTAIDAFPAFDLSDAFIAALRQGGPMTSGFVLPPLPPELERVERRDILIPGWEGAPDVRLLLFVPPAATAAPRPAFLHIHGGGFVLGSAEMSDQSGRATALEQDCIVASVDYRLAPETRWPGPVDDCYAALRWLHEQAEALGIDPSRIAVGGESAGGGHAAALAILARDRGDYPICLQLLDQPMLDDRTGSGSDPHPYTGEFIWTAERNRYGWGALLGMEPGGDDVPAAAVPARTADLSGLPPACITVGALDLFVEEDIDYARRLLRAGVPTELHIMPGGYHGFGAAGPDAPQVAEVMRQRSAALARAFARP
ncbi:alpha/beta hydrolase [Sphingobium sufflavum]|uniref:alpha/beta hydrolase n=1 Tax=Sphingobium sufflavum TaxID=1129547 RepID=UPI001F37695B|nr:alpha/beta hydrolase [Sphingobium sufflavum]MCE7796882.1 alpha/beta hydrolase [Sphingobium sufflavum]